MHQCTPFANSWALLWVLWFYLKKWRVCWSHCKLQCQKQFKSMYQHNIDARKLELQLQMLLDLVQAFRKSKNLTWLTVTKVSTITEMVVAVPMARDMFSEVDKLIRLYLTIPVTTCRAERSFCLSNTLRLTCIWDPQRRKSIWTTSYCYMYTKKKQKPSTWQKWLVCVC